MNAHASTRKHPERSQAIQRAPTTAAQINADVPELLTWPLTEAGVASVRLKPPEIGCTPIL